MRNKMVRETLVLLFFLVLAFPSMGRADASPPVRRYRFGLNESPLSSQPAGGNSFWVEAAASGGYNPLALGGGTFAFGYQSRYLGFDVRGGFMLANYGGIGATPDGTDPYATPPAATSELARARSATDGWWVSTVQPGISISGRAFAESVPLLTEKARFGLGFGMFDDETNSLLFLGWSYSFQAALQYQFGWQSPWSLEVAVSYNAARGYIPGEGADGTLPFNWLGLSAGLMYWF